MDLFLFQSIRCGWSKLKELCTAGTRAKHTKTFEDYSSRPRDSGNLCKRGQMLEPHNRSIVQSASYRVKRKNHRTCDNNRLQLNRHAPQMPF